MKFYITKNGNIYGRVMVCKKQVKIYPGYTVATSHWSKKSQKVLASHPRSDIINKVINKLRDSHFDIVANAKITGTEISASKMHTLLLQSIGIGTVHPKYTLQQYADHWLTLHRKVSTNSAYKSKIITMLQTFPRLSWQDITPSWKNMAIDILGRKYKPNTVNKLMAVFKTMLLSARSEGMPVNVPDKMVPPSARVETGYLTTDEIRILQEAADTMPQHLRNAVRLWLLLYCTGQRVSDVSGLIDGQTLNVQGHNMIRITQQKTDITVSIPYSSMLENLIAHPPTILSNLKLNRYIRSAAKLAGLGKADQITSHTARRSCATNLVLAGMPIQQVMNITGHTSEKEFRKYVRYDDIAGAIIVSGSSIYHNTFK